MNNNLSIGQTILELRKEKGATQEELAKAVCISAQAVSKWENGGTPDIELLPAIADYFNISIDRLFGRKVTPNVCESVQAYVYGRGQFQGFDQAFNVYHALHSGLVNPSISKLEQNGILAYHNAHENGYSLLVSNGYGNFVKREFWEAINIKTLTFSQELYAFLAEPGTLEVIYAMLCRKAFGPANFEMIKNALQNVKRSDEEIKGQLDILVERRIVIIEESPYSEIGKTYEFNDDWYLGLCAIICATQALKLTLPGFSCYMGRGGWPIAL